MDGLMEALKRTKTFEPPDTSSNEAGYDRPLKPWSRLPVFARSFSAPRTCGSVKPPCGSLKKKAISTIPQSRPGALTWGSDVFII
jgi:hypothetical protein